MKTIWKYGIPIGNNFVLELPVGARPLCVMNQRKTAQMWVLLDPENPIQKRNFRLSGTNHPLADDIQHYVGSFQMADGSLVFHVFEE